MNVPMSCENGRGEMRLEDRQRHFAACKDPRCQTKLLFCQVVAKWVEDQLEKETTRTENDDATDASVKMAG